MAQYKVPQDVEADDKLIGPFSFRQFVYLLVAAGLIALAVGLFQIFPLLAIIPLPPVLLFLALALPLKKDQPMETYLAALVSFYLKPHTRIWTPGQRESTIKITAPKIVEEVRTRDLSQEEATHRLSFLADIVDTEGYAITGMANNSMRDDLLAEANATDDIFDNYKTASLDRAISQDKAERHEEAIRGMKEAISRNNEMNISNTTIKNDHGPIPTRETSVKTSTISAQKPSAEVSPMPAQKLAVETNPATQGSYVSLPTREPSVGNSSNVDATKTNMVLGPSRPTGESFKATTSSTVVQPVPAAQTSSNKIDSASHFSSLDSQKNVAAAPPKPSIIELANNPDFTVATIAKEANRINRKEEGEVFISLH